MLAMQNLVGHTDFKIGENLCSFYLHVNCTGEASCCFFQSHTGSRWSPGVPTAPCNDLIRPLN